MCVSKPHVQVAVMIARHWHPLQRSCKQVLTVVYIIYSRIIEVKGHRVTWWVACYDSYVILNKPATSDTHSLKKGRMGHLCLFVVAVITSYIVQIGASECDGSVLAYI